MAKQIESELENYIRLLCERLELMQMEAWNRRTPFTYTIGKDFVKIIKESRSVWGFVAIDNGIHKGIPYESGDVFKAASWRQPAKHQRGSVYNYLDNSWYDIYSPKYLKRG